MELIINDGRSSKSLITFKGTVYNNNSTSQCKVLTKFGKEIVVPSDYLHFVENPDIASIPQTSEDYCRECTNIN